MATGRSVGHPDEIVASAYLDGALEPEAADRVEQHLASCDDCRATLRAARDEARPTEVPVPAGLLARARELGGSMDSRSFEVTGTHAGSNGWRTPVRWVLAGGMAAAAVALIGFVLVGRLPSDRREGAPAGESGEGRRTKADARYRASGQGERTAGQDDLIALAPLAGAIVVGPQTTFSWSARPDADRYIVTVLDAGGAIVATIEARAPAHSAVFTWEGQRPATLLWRVRALQGGGTLSESRPVAFEMR